MNPRPQAEMPAMSDYGVEEDSWNPLSWEWAAARLSTPRNYWLATVDGNGRPASSPVWGVWDDDRLRYAFGCAANSRKARNIAALPSLVGTQLIAQTFIYRRSKARWLAHQLVFWGCILAAMITFPLTLGLLHFESVGQDADRYKVFVSGLPTMAFDAGSIIGWIIFHGLDIAAVLVLGGVFMFLRRRLNDPGALAVERGGDFLVLAGLFAVSVTGLFLTVSSMWLHGQFYSALNTLHALTVILGLMYLPFGKLFHIFQRPGNLGVAYYRQANEEGPAAVCRRCGEGFASVRQIADLQEVLPQVGFDYGIDGGGNYQDTCPKCRRASVTLAQVARVGGFG